MGKAKSSAGYYYDAMHDRDRDDSVRSTGLMWMFMGTGTAFMTTGIVLWAKSPGDEKYYNMKNGIIGPQAMKSGFGLTYQRSF